MKKPSYVFVVPKDGMKIRDEYTLELIPPEGALVKRTRLTERRLISGDLAEQVAPAEKAAPKPKKGE